MSRSGFFVVLGIALPYTGLSLADTMAMAASDRSREPAVLRLTGDTGGQILRLVAAEALTAAVVGGLLGALVTAVDPAGMRGAPALLSVRPPIGMPWPTLAAAAAARAVLAVVAAVVPAALALRRRAVGPAGVRE
ncbi:ABC transporter permease [Streptomyces sp. NPDC006798]|uniref:ABC transporter permease n=1 Tax=Streptomyces sp. NPDC006798 TaxID=3155462 RepID=UPI0033DDB26E